MDDNHSSILYLVIGLFAIFGISQVVTTCRRSFDKDPTVFDIGDGYYHTSYCFWVNEYNIEGSYDTPAEARADGLKKHSCCPDESQYDDDDDVKDNFVPIRRGSRRGRFDSDYDYEEDYEEGVEDYDEDDEDYEYDY